jgi:O-antigen/teichoic acid export membrane protein
MVETNEAKVAKQSFRASFVLLVGNVLSSLFLAITVFIIARLLGPSNYGEYTVALVIPGTLVLLTGMGMNTALLRYSAFHISRGEIGLARRKSRSAALALLLLGAIFSVVNFFGASFFSILVFHRPELVPLVQLGSGAIIGQAMLQAVVAGFIGWANSGKASIALVSQAGLKLALSPLLVILGYSIFGAILAHTLSYLIIGAAFYAIFFALKLRGSIDRSKNIVSDIKEMISFSLPEYGGRVMLQFSQQSYLVIILAIVSSNITVAYYQAAWNVTTNLTMFSTIIAQALLPAFANLSGVGGNIKLAFVHAQKYTLYAVTPIVFLLIGTSSLLMEAFYGHAYLGGAIYLQLLSVAFLPYVLGAAILPPMFNGLARTRLTLFMLLVSSIALIVLAPIFADLLHLVGIGLIISLFLSNTIQLLVGMSLAKRHIGISVHYSAVTRCILAVAISYGGMYLATLQKFGFLEALIVSVLVFSVLYLTLAPALRVMRKDEFSQLKTSAEGLGVLSKIISLVLAYELFILKITSIKKSETSTTV